MVKNKRVKFDKAFPYLMCLPALILFLALVVTPFIEGLRTSFFSWDGLGEMKWMGIKNYKFVLRDDVFWKAMGNTFIYAILVTVLKNVIAMVLALILVKQTFMKSFFRVCVYMPVTFNYVVVGVLWTWIFNPTLGIMNSFLGIFGMTDFPGWLSDPNIALYSIIAVDVWKWMGFHTIILFGGLQGISADLYEAAEIDGANAWERFLHITIPQLNSSLVVSLLLSITGAFLANFNLVNVMTGGGPSHATEVALTYITTTSLRFSTIGKANAMSMVLFVFVFIFGFLQLKVYTREDNYE